MVYLYKIFHHVLFCISNLLLKMIYLLSLTLIFAIMWRIFHQIILFHIEKNIDNLSNSPLDIVFLLFKINI